MVNPYPKMLLSVHSLGTSPPGCPLAAWFVPRGKLSPSILPPRPSQGLPPATQPPTTAGDIGGGNSLPQLLAGFLLLFQHAGVTMVSFPLFPLTPCRFPL